MNILIIGGRGDTSSANSVCIRNLARVFNSRGHKVWNLASGDKFVNSYGEEDGMIICHIPPSYHDSLYKKTRINSFIFYRFLFLIESIIRHIIIYPLYPKASIIREKKVFNKANNLVRINNINLVIAIYNNFDNIYAGMKLKSLYGDNISVVSYHLDLRTASRNKSGIIRRIVKDKAIKSIKDENKIVDRILVPFSGQEEIMGIDGLLFDKISFVGFPVFISEVKYDSCVLPFENDCINISYIGSLSSDNRNPCTILSFFEKVSSILEKKIKIHFWGDVGGMESMIDNSSVAEYHGKIENRFVKYLMDNSDFLLNIGNAIAYNMLPSKVFSSFASGKPIVNVINHPLDATIQYFKTYNNSIDLHIYRDNETELITSLAQWLTSKRNAPLRETEGLFDSFKPEVICDLILS